MTSPKQTSAIHSFPAGLIPGEFNAWLVFKLDELDFAVGLSVVERVVQAVEITPLPEAPRGVRGMINYQGRIVPVFDLWTRFGRPSRELRVTDHLAICHTHRRTVALLVNSVTGVVAHSDVQMTPAAEILPDLESVTGVIKLEGSMAQVHDLERFLSIEDHDALQMMLKL